MDDNNIATPSFGIAYDFTQRWGFELDNSYAIADYKERNDRNEYDGNLRLLYRFGRVYSGFLNYRHTILNYDQETDEDYQVYEPSIGVRVDFQDNARIQIGAGYYIQDFETSEDQQGFNITSDIYKRWVYRTIYFDVSGGSGYSIDDNGAQDNGLNIYYQGRMEMGYHFTPMFTGLIFGSYRYDEYPDETPDRTENTTIAGLSIEWQALQWMIIGLTYDFTDRKSVV